MTLLDAALLVLKRYGFPTLAALGLGLFCWKQMELNAAQLDAQSRQQQMQMIWLEHLAKDETVTVAAVTPCAKGLE